MVKFILDFRLMIVDRISDERLCSVLVHAKAKFAENAKSSTNKSCQSLNPAHPDLDFRLMIVDWLSDEKLCSILFHAKATKMKFAKNAKSPLNQDDPLIKQIKVQTT